MATAPRVHSNPPASAKEWTDRLDMLMREDNNLSVSDLMSWAYANGTAAGVGVDPNHEAASHDDQAVLVSADHGWIVEWHEVSGYWYAR